MESYENFASLGLDVWGLDWGLLSSQHYKDYVKTLPRNLWDFTVEQIKRVFGDNYKIIFFSSP